MGSVAQIAAGFLAERLAARLVVELDPRAYFGPHTVVVRDGLLRAAPAPRSRLFACVPPAARRDYLVFLGEAQPAPSEGHRMCEELAGLALEHGVERVITFAALATTLSPEAEPLVFGVATQRKLLHELRARGVPIRTDGQISGLNGVLLDVAANHGLPGLCFPTTPTPSTIPRLHGRS